MTLRNELGMLFFVASEAVFFLSLVLAYVNFHGATGEAAAKLLDPIKTGFFSIALLSSSFTFWRAEVAHDNKKATVKWWLLATVLLGLTFIVGQAMEYTELLTRNVTISRDFFGTTFFTLTGFHGLHVIIGLILLAMLLALSFVGRPGEPAKTGMQTIGIYWHFVDAVWVVIFSIVYLWRYV